MCSCDQVESYKPNASVFHTMRENLYYNTMHTFKNDMVGVHGIGNEFACQRVVSLSILSRLIRTVTN